MKSRDEWMDGLKFFSMLGVYLCHLRMAFFYDFPDYFVVFNYKIPSLIFDGNIPVCMFLLVSIYLFICKGECTEIGFENNIKVVYKRFFRLAIPAFFVYILIFVMFNLGLFYNSILTNEFSAPVSSSWFYSKGTINSLIGMIHAILNSVVFGFGYNPPLWCYSLLFIMPICGYFISQLFDFNKIKGPILYLLIICLINNSYWGLLCFAFIIKIYKDRIKDFVYLLILLLSIFILILRINFNLYVLDRVSILINSLIVFSIFGLFYNHEKKNILNFKFFSICNKISFSVYLLHMVVICSIGCYLISIGCLRIIAIIITTCVLFLICIPFHLFVEKRLTNFVMKLFSIF